MLFNNNNSIQHYLFVCIQLNGSKYSYASLTIQLNISHLFARNFNVKQFYFTHRWDPIIYHHSGLEETWEQLHWKGTPHSQSFRTGYCLISNLRHFVRGGYSYPSTEMQSAYSSAPANLVEQIRVQYSFCKIYRSALYSVWAVTLRSFDTLLHFSYNKWGMKIILRNLNRSMTSSSVPSSLNVGSLCIFLNWQKYPHQVLTLEILKPFVVAHWLIFLMHCSSWYSAVCI